MALRPGEPLPDLELVDPDGGVRRLPGLATEATVLVFLRHLG